MRIEVICGNPAGPGRTSNLGRDVGARLAELIGIDPPGNPVELMDFAAAFSDWSSHSAQTLKRTILAADFLIFAAPTYKASMPGMLKSALDLFNPDELRDKTAIIVFTGVSMAHKLAPELALRPVLLELGASVPTQSLYCIAKSLDEPNSLAADFVHANRFVLHGAAHARVRIHNQ